MGTEESVEATLQWVEAWSTRLPVHHEPIHTQPVEALTNPPAASRRERGSTGAFPSYAADHGEHGTLRERCRDGQKPPLPPSSNPSETKLEVSDNST